MRPQAKKAAQAPTSPSLLPATMSFDQVRALLAPPSTADSEQRAVVDLNAKFKSWEDFEALPDDAFNESKARSEALDAEVRRQVT